MNNEYSRDSRETGLSEYLFKVRGQGGVVFDYVVVARHAVHAQAEVSALFGNHVIALQTVRRIS